MGSSESSDKIEDHQSRLKMCITYMQFGYVSPGRGHFLVIQNTKIWMGGRNLQE